MHCLETMKRKQDEAVARELAKAERDGATAKAEAIRRAMREDEAT